MPLARIRSTCLTRSRAFINFAFTSAFFSLTASSLAAEVPLADSNPKLIRTPSDADAWGGVAAARSSQRVADYQLKATLDPKTHQLVGTEVVRWRNRSNVTVSSLYVHLYLNAFESEGSTFAIERRRLGGFRSDVETKAGEWGFIELRSVTQGGRPVPWQFVHPDQGPETDHTVVRFDLPEPVAAFGETTLNIDFFDQLPRVVARTGWFDSFHLVGQWYPKIGVLELAGERGATAPRWNCHEFHLNSEFYADFGNYQLDVVVPEGFTVVGSGTPRAAPTAKPDGVHFSFEVSDVHDVVFSAYDKFASPVESSTGLSTGDTVAVSVHAPAEYRAAAETALTATLDAVTWFSANLGPYPYPHITVVIPPYNAAEAGGMEYETFFTTVGGLSPPLSSTSLIRFVTIHEFAHGYVSGLLATNEFEEPFLDEGMNEFLVGRMLRDEVAQFEVPTLARWLGIKPLQYNSLTTARLGGRPRFPTDPIAAPSWNRFSGGSYGQVYSRTHAVMNDLSVILGEEVTARAIKNYYQSWHFRHPSTADLKQAFVGAGGDRSTVERWFEAQVYGAAAIDDRVVTLSTEPVWPDLGSQLDGGTRVSFEEEARDKLVEEEEKKWKLEHGEVDDEGPGAFPCRSRFSVRRYGAGVSRTLEARFPDGGVERFPWSADERWRRFEIERPTCVTSVELDTDGALLLDDNPLDDKRNEKTSAKAAIGAGVETLGWLQTLTAFLEAL
jgi:hypothetical protein